MSIAPHKMIQAADLTLMSKKTYTIWNTIDGELKAEFKQVLTYIELLPIDVFQYTNFNDETDINQSDSLFILGTTDFDTLFFIHPDHML